MLKTLRASVLLLALTVSAQAGEILTPPVVTPPPQGAPAQLTAQSESDLQLATQGDMHYPLVRIALTLLGLF